MEQATRAEAEGKRAGADIGGGAGQVLIKPMGHEARSRCGYTRRARKGEAGKSKEQPQRAESRVPDSGFGERSRRGQFEGWIERLGGSTKAGSPKPH